MEFAFGYDNDKLICGLKNMGLSTILSQLMIANSYPISNKILTQTTTFFPIIKSLMEFLQRNRLF